MALSRVHTWSAGDILLASDLNAEFNNVLTNALTLINPLTGNLSGGGFQINNVIIGASTPLAGTFTTLTATALMDLSSAAAGQIKFPATQNPSADVNTLDDYEEGTWTPTIAGSGTAGTQTYSIQVGWYTKIGNLVTIFGGFTMTAKDGSTAGSLSILGLPFTAKNTTGYIAPFATTVSTLDLDAGYSMVNVSATPNTTTALLTEAGDNVASQALVAANLQATTTVRFQGSYIV